MICVNCVRPMNDSFHFFGKDACVCMCGCNLKRHKVEDKGCRWKGVTEVSEDNLELVKTMRNSIENIKQAMGK